LALSVNESTIIFLFLLAHLDAPMFLELPPLFSFQNGSFFFFLFPRFLFAGSFKARKEVKAEGWSKVCNTTMSEPSTLAAAEALWKEVGEGLDKSLQGKKQ